ncbi:MAG: erythromycin esterase family protein [Flavobacteriaceae bacterium]
MKLISILIISIVFLNNYQTKAQDASTWLLENTSEISVNNNYDFSEIKKAIGSKRIVAIGESSHGLGEFYRLKAALVAYLHKEMGFEVLAMEGGLGDINLAFSHIDTLNFEQLRDETVFGNFRAAEANSVFQYIVNQSKTPQKLYYTGYDTQASSSYLVKTLRPLLEPYNKNLSDSLQYKFWGYGASFRAGNQGDSINYYKYQKLFLDAAKDSEEIIKKNKEDIIQKRHISEFQYTIILRALNMFQKSYNLSFTNRYDGTAVRDELMAKNVKWLIDSIYPNKKFIIWAHNVHIEKQPVENNWGIKWMGHYLKEWYPQEYYALGLFAYEGNTYQHWTQEVTPFLNNGKKALEKKFFETGKSISFLNIEQITKTNETQWLFEPLSGFELENGGTIDFIPTKRFDGIINVSHSEIPTYKKE